MKEIIDMTDRELLEELVEAKRKQDRREKTRWIILGVFLLVLIYLGFRFIPPIIATLQSIEQALNELNGYGEQIGQSLQALDGLNIDPQKLNETLEKLNSLQIDPQKIEDLMDQIATISALLDQLGSFFR
ncbi:MAG: hypothetical protein IKE21_01625 [Erysipelotrichaceae bacterium]|nr:hypothetical protein [Erysipelotrichaceae bacterium]